MCVFFKAILCFRVNKRNRDALNAREHPLPPAQVTTAATFRILNATLYHWYNNVLSFVAIERRVSVLWRQNEMYHIWLYSAAACC